MKMVRQPAVNKETLDPDDAPESSTNKAKFITPPFDIDTNDPIPKELLPKDHLERYRTRYCRKGVSRFQGTVA